MFIAFLIRLVAIVAVPISELKPPIPEIQLLSTKRLSTTTTFSVLVYFNVVGAIS